MDKVDEKNQNLRNLYNIAVRYYHDDVKQSEISKEWKMSPSKVSALLKEAEKYGIVKHIVKAPDHLLCDLEEELREKYNLRDARVIISSSDEMYLLRRLGEKAVECVLPRVKKNSKIGISGGRTLWWFVRNFKSERIHNLDIYGLAACSYEPIEYAASTLVGIAVGNLNEKEKRIEKTPNVKGHGLLVPSFSTVQNKTVAEIEEEKRELLDRFLDVKRTLEDAKRNVSFIITGIGALTSNSAIFQASEELGAENLEELKKLGGKGDILYNVYDEDCVEIECKLNAHTISLRIDDLVSIRERDGEILAVAGGSYKKESILAALRCKPQFISCLITDEEVARYLINPTN